MYIIMMLERALSSFIDIILSGGFSFYHKYEVLKLLYLSRQSSSTNSMSTDILLLIIRYIAQDIWIATTMEYFSSYIQLGGRFHRVNVYFIQMCKYILALSMWLISRKK